MSKKVKITLEMECNSILELENNLGMDENFDLIDSIIWLLDYGNEQDYETYHNKIKLTVDRSFLELPYKESKDEQN